MDLKGGTIVVGSKGRGIAGSKMAMTGHYYHENLAALKSAWGGLPHALLRL